MALQLEKRIEFIGDNSGKKVISCYEKLAGEYAKKWDTDITFCLCHGDYGKVPVDLSFDKLYIFVQLLPNNTDGVEKSHVDYLRLDSEKLVFPIKEDTANPALACPQGDTLKFKNLPKDAHLITDDEDQPIAVVYGGNAIYIMNDFIHCRSKEELDISVKIFEFVMRAAEKEADILKTLKAGMEEKAQKALRIALEKQLTQRLEKERITLKATSDTMEQYNKGIVECTRKAIVAERVITALQNNLNDIPSMLGKTWDEIHKMMGGDLYESVSFMHSGLKAITTPIFIEYGGNKYQMGKYEVTLGFNGNTVIKALEKLPTVRHDHPHVSGGNPCWGNFAGEIPKRIGYGEFDVALVLIHTFLCHFDSNAPYETIENWPKVKKEKVKEKVDV